MATSEEHEARSAVERATELSEDMVQALEDGGRAAVEAVKLFLVTVEEALPQVEGARRVEKKITESALKMAEQLIHTQSEFLQKVVDSAGKSLSRSEEEK
jgi:flagellar biosynthesis/type III secretory pathway protein FliH